MNVKLYKGDCLEVMKNISDNSIDMILCDLPYGTTKCKWDVVIPFEPLWEQYNRIIKNNGAIVLFGAEPFSSQLRLSNLKMYKYDWVWNKVTAVGHLVAKMRPLQQTENIIIFGKQKINYFPIMIKRPYAEKSHEYKRTSIMGGNSNQYSAIYTEWYPKNILTFSNAIHNGLHPTQKPIELLKYLIKTYTKENETVLDNCMGSGSTGVACINTNRNFIGIELDENYFRIAKERIESEKSKLRHKPLI